LAVVDFSVAGVDVSEGKWGELRLLWMVMMSLALASGFGFTPPATIQLIEACRGCLRHAAQRTARRIIAPPPSCRCTKQSALFGDAYEPFRAVAIDSNGYDNCHCTRPFLTGERSAIRHEFHAIARIALVRAALKYAVSLEWRALRAGRPGPRGAS
jgi:hypothetical protein